MLASLVVYVAQTLMFLTVGNIVILVLDEGLFILQYVVDSTGFAPHLGGKSGPREGRLRQVTLLIMPCGKV